MSRRVSARRPNRLRARRGGLPSLLLEQLEPRRLLSGTPVEPPELSAEFVGAGLVFAADGPADAETGGVAVSQASAAPQVELTAAISFDHGGTSGSVGDAVTARLVLGNRPGATAADAFEVAVDFPLPVTGQSWISAPLLTVSDSAGIVTAASFELVGSNATGWTLRSRPGAAFDLPVDPARTITLTARGTVSNAILPGNTVRSAAVVTWTSLPGGPEHTDVGGGDSYRAVALADLRATDFGFSLGVVFTIDSATAGGWVVVGEIVRHRVVAVVPEGQISSTAARLRVEIPAGLRFLDAGSARIAFVSNGGLSSSRY
ncbi:MAG: hypothetical protein WD072_04155, partial [Pirellulales bacterium]